MFPTSSGHLAIRWKPRSRSFWKAGTTGTTWPCWPSEAQRTSTSLGLGWAGNGWELLPWFWDVSFFGVLGILWFLWLLKYTEMMVTWNWRFPGGLATTAARILAAMWNLWSWGITPVPLSWLPQKSWGPMFASCHLKACFFESQCSATLWPQSWGKRGALVMLSSVRRMYQQQGCKVMVTGHSLGGYLAEVVATTLGAHTYSQSTPIPNSPIVWVT